MRLFKKEKGTPRTRALPSPEEVINLARRYVVQETVRPLKQLAKVLGLGLAGALVFGLGLIIVLLGLLRLLQTETGTVFAGDWRFAPYLITAAVGALVTALCALGVSSRLRRSESTL